MNKWRLWRLMATLLALALLAAACGDDDDESASTTSTEETTEATDESEEAAETEESDEAMEDAAAGELETTELKLGVIPIADVAPVFIALDRGYFEEEGLTVTTEFAAGGAAAIPAVVAGDIDLAFGAYPSALKAIEEGIPLVLTQEAVRSGELFAGLYSLPDSGIETVADLEGKTIAVNTLNNIVQIAVEAHLQDAGLTLDDVTLVEIGFPDMVAALELGDVDVISVVEPFGTIARNTLDATLVIDMFTNRLADFPVAGWMTTDEWATAHPNTIAAFNRAFAKATDVANNEEGALAEIVPTYTSSSPEAAAELNYPNMVAGLDADYLQIVSDFMVDQGILEAPVNVADHVFTG